MKRTLPRLLTLIAITALSNASLRATPIQTVVHAATSGTPLVIAVLSDHYTDQAEFNLDVDNFIEFGLLAHPFYASRAADLHIVSLYEPLTTGTSNYEFDVEVPSADCVMSWSEANTAGKVEAAVFTVNPEHTIVIGNHHYDIGCTYGEWSYVALDASSSDVLSHEMGHGLGGLLDEWFPASRAGMSHPGIPGADTKNCYDTRNGVPPPWNAPEPWKKLTNLTPHQGCGLYQLDVVHGRPLCLMGNTNHTDFCEVCHHHMEDAFAYIQNPEIENPSIDTPDLPNPDIANPDVENPRPPKSPADLRIIKTAYAMQPTPLPPPKKVPGPVATAKPATPLVRLVVSFNPVNGAITPKRAFPTTGRYLPAYRRLGQYVYEILDNDQTIAVGVFPAQSYETRSYGGGTQHQTSPPRQTDLTIQMPISSEWLKDPKHNVSIKMWWLAPGVSEPLITPAVFAKLRLDKKLEPRGQTVTGKDIANVM